MRLVLTGELPGGRRLSRPLAVEMIFDGEDDDGEWIVSDPTYHIHGVGATKEAAIAAFKRILVGDLQLLSKHEPNLGERMQAELAYLRELVISPATVSWQ